LLLHNFDVLLNPANYQNALF